MLQYQYLTIMCMELQCDGRANFAHDPNSDPIRAIYFTIQYDGPRKSGYLKYLNLNIFLFLIVPITGTIEHNIVNTYYKL